MAVDRSTNRAQIGAGTLLILVAVLIVAATTAGVLFNVTGALESRADITGEAVSSEVEDPLRVAAVTGRVDETADPRVLSQVRLVVELDGGPGVDLSRASVWLQTPDGTDSLRYDPAAPIQGERFAVEALTDPDSSAPVLTESADSFAVVLDTPALQAHDPVTLEVTLASGATETVEFRVPERVRTQSAVTLG